MIIDLHTHIWSGLDQLGREISDNLLQRQGERWTKVDASPAAHQQAMQCVDASLVLGFRSDRLAARVPNELVAEFVSRDPQHRLGVAGIDPMAADGLEQIERALRLGLVAVTVAPACQGFHPAHSSAMRLYDECERRNLPLFATQLGPLTSSAELEFSRPTLWDEVARSFPTLPIVIGGLGYPWVDETLVLVGKHRNVFAEISGVVSRPWELYNALLSASSLGVMDKLLFGSAFPFETPTKAIEAAYGVNSYSHGTQLPSVPRSLIRGIIERDALACLGIESHIAPRRTPESAPDLTVRTFNPFGRRARSGHR